MRKILNLRVRPQRRIEMFENELYEMADTDRSVNGEYGCRRC